MKLTKSPKKTFTPPGTKKNQSCLLTLIQISLVTFSSIWLLAVIKVFILEKHRIYSGGSDLGLSSTSTDKLTIKNFVSSRDTVNLEGKSLDTKDQSLDVPSSGDWLIKRAPLSEKKAQGEERKPRPVLKVSVAPNLPSEPSESELEAMENEAKESETAVTKLEPVHLVRKKTKSILEAYELPWPPVQSDNSIPDAEGTEIMPITGLKVPRFWEAPPGTDLNKYEQKVDGHETIFLMIASYRDFQCRETIASAFNKADHPERLFIGAVDQLSDGDAGCLDIAIPCSEDPEQRICKYWNQVSIYKMDAALATGPVTARHIGDRLYRGQHFIMQMDAHCLFIRHWDTKLIKQWENTGNEMAVLSSYLTDVQESIDANGDSTRNTRPIMCNSDFEGTHPQRYLRHGSQPEDVPVIKDMPQLQPFWAAGFSFSRGHFVVRVPYDYLQSMVFQGEEITIGIRGFTYGYDFYAPRDSVVFHEYAERSSRRKKIPMFWENSQKHIGEGQKSLKRSMAIIGMAPDLDPETWDHSALDKYGIGSERKLDLFYKLFLIDPYARKATQLCPFVKSGIMHNEFQKYLRTNGQGIDYSFLENFDTTARMQDVFKSQRPAGEVMLRNAINSRKLDRLKDAIDNADRIGINRTNQKLYNQAKELFEELNRM